jgi:hypothetical protein
MCLGSDDSAVVAQVWPFIQAPSGQATVAAMSASWPALQRGEVGEAVDDLLWLLGLAKASLLGVARDRQLDGGDLASCSDFMVSSGTVKSRALP